MRDIRVLAGLLMLLLISGCSSIKETVGDYLADDEPTAVPPSELVELNESLDVFKLWSVDVGDGADEQYFKLTPMIFEGGIYAADREGEVTAVDKLSGSRLWNVDIDLPVSGGPGVGDGLAVVGTTDGEVVALSQESGQQVWQARVSSEVLATPVISQGVVVIRTGDGKVHGLDVADGQRLWIYDRSVPALSLRGTSNPIITGESVIIGFDNGRLGALSLLSGKPLWETRIVIPSGRSELDRMVDIDADPIIRNGIIYVATFQGQIAAVNMDTGRNLWARDISSYAGISVDDIYVYVADEEGSVWALERLSGNSVWKQDALTGRQLSAPAALGEYLVVGDFEGYLHWMDRNSGDFLTRSRADDTRIIASPVVDEEVIYVYSSGGILSAFRPN